MSMPDEATDFTSRMAEDENPLSRDTPDPAAAPADEGDGEGAADGTPPPSVAPNPDPALLSRLDKLEADLIQSRMETQYLRGQSARETRTAPAEEAPKLYEPNLEEFGKQLEANPGTAIPDLIRKITESAVKVARHEMGREVDGKLGQTQQQAQLRQSLEREGQEVAREYSDLIGTRDGKPINEAFDRECYDYAQDLAARAGNPVIQSGPLAGSRALSPGHMRAAADAVYGKWARANKLPTKTETPANGNQPRSLRQIIDQVPASDHLGTNGARNGKSSNGGIPKTIEDLAATGFYDRVSGDRTKAIAAARNVCKMNGWNEARYVANMVEAERNGELSN